MEEIDGLERLVNSEVYKREIARQVADPGGGLAPAPGNLLRRRSARRIV